MLERVDTENLPLLLEVGLIDETEYMNQLTERVMEREKEEEDVSSVQGSA